MKYLLVFASCMAAATADFAGFQGNSGGYQSSSSGGSFSGGYQSSNNNGASSSSGGYSGQFNGFGNAASSLGSVGQGGLGGFGNFQAGVSGLSSSSGGDLGGFQGGAGASTNQQGGQIRRFVSVHVAPSEEAVSTEPRIIRAGGPQDTHVNIIFVKAPSASSQQQTEVVLPEQPQQKTLVYVLVKKPEGNQNDVKIRAPAPTKPSKPEVYFIRYKSDSAPAAGAGTGNGNAGFGVSSGSSAYGPPPQPNAPTSLGGYQ